MRGDPLGVEPRVVSVIAQGDGDRLPGDGVEADSSSLHAGLQRSGPGQIEPRAACPNRIGRRMLAVDHGDALAFAVLVGLGPGHGYQEAAGLELDVAKGVRCTNR